MVDVGHGPHDEVVGGEDQATPVALHSEYPEEVVGVKGRLLEKLFKEFRF